MSRSSVTIALYLLLVFSSGAAVGVFGYRVYSGTPVNARPRQKPSPEEVRRQFLNEMQTRCKLTPEQTQQVVGITDETRAKFHETHQRYDADLRAIRDGQHQRIAAILNPEQRSEYEKMRAEREARAKATAAANKR